MANKKMRKKKSRYLFGVWVMDTYTQQKQIDYKNLNSEEADLSWKLIYGKYK